MIHIQRQLDSTTLHLPELHSFLGKTVEIVVRETELPTSRSAEGLANDGIDPDVCSTFRLTDQEQGADLY